MAKKQKVELGPTREWERQPMESVAQYERFCAYRDMKYQVDDPRNLLSSAERMALGHRTGQRSLRNLARQLGCSRQALELLSSKFHWAARAEAYDLDVEARIRADNETDLFRMRKTHAELARQMLTKAARGLLMLEDRELDAGSVARLVDVGVKVERLSRGESTEIQQVSGRLQEEHTHTINLSELSVEDLRRLAALGGEANGPPG